MISLSLRSLTATTLSLWIGVLACVLGCAMPSAASPTAPDAQRSGPKTVQQCADPAGDDGQPCCRHGHHPADGSEKNHHRSISCCPAETALIQKQNAVPPVSTELHVAVLMLPNFHSSNFVSANASASPS